MSFGFKYGIPTEADLMFDVRCFPNPFYVDRLRPKNGLDQEIQNFVMQDESSQKFAEKLFDMVDFLLPLYCNEGKRYIIKRTYICHTERDEKRAALVGLGNSSN